MQQLLALRLLLAADTDVCPYADTSLVVPKKDGGFRICVDNSQLNKETVKDQYLLPHIAEIFTELHSAPCFLSLDLLMGYH